jgi:excisionase family DNA binding protein
VSPSTWRRGAYDQQTARASRTESLARSAEGGAGALDRDQDKEVIELRGELLRAQEVARILGVGRSKAYELMLRGELPVIRIGRLVRAPRHGLDQWILDRTEWRELG